MSAPGGEGTTWVGTQLRRWKPERIGKAWHQDRGVPVERTAVSAGDHGMIACELASAEGGRVLVGAVRRSSEPWGQ